eukprot:8372978-Alexandrium_andersonii.AAC.1
MRRKGQLAHWASWGRDLPGRAWGKISSFDQRVRRPCGCSDPRATSKGVSPDLPGCRSRSGR